jgi:hypothetical protein
VKAGPTATCLERLMGVAGGVSLVHDPNQFTDTDLASD